MDDIIAELEWLEELEEDTTERELELLELLDAPDE